MVNYKLGKNLKKRTNNNYNHNNNNKLNFENTTLKKHILGSVRNYYFI